MDKTKLFLALYLISLLFLILIFSPQKPSAQGKIKSIGYQTGLTTITLENLPEEIVIFTDEILLLKKSDSILVYGKKETYHGKKQIIADKIILLP